MTRKTGSADNGRRFQSQSKTDHPTKRIETDVLQNSNQLASELDLAKDSGVTRGAVRNALDFLSTRCIVTTKHGVGSFISSVGHSLSKTRINAKTTEELRWLDVEANTYRNVRYHVNTNKPMSKDISCISSSHTRNLLMERELLDESISLTTEATETRPVSSVQSVQTTRPPATYSSQLKIQEGNRFLKVERTNFDKNGQPVSFRHDSPRPLFISHRIRKAQP